MGGWMGGLVSVALVNPMMAAGVGTKWAPSWGRRCHATSRTINYLAPDEIITRGRNSTHTHTHTHTLKVIGFRMNCNGR